MNTAQIFNFIALLSGVFSIGAVTLLYLQRRTVILRLVLLFLVSLVLIIFAALAAESSQDQGERVSIAAAFAGITGMILNIFIVPHLTAAVCSRSIEQPIRALLWAWNGILLSAGLIYPFLGDPAPVFTIMNIQLVVTITASIIFMAVNLNGIPRAGLRKSAAVFLVISAVFLVLLVFDMLITRFAINQFSFFDGLSLPLYILALNAGSFIFAERVLDTEPLLQRGRITEACRSEYALTERETEIIEALHSGKTNRELSEVLFISVKTVENHLYNIYRKMGVKNRVQLLGTLKSWTEERRE